VARHYAGLLVVPRGVPGQLENLQASESQRLLQNSGEIRAKLKKYTQELGPHRKP
jgi:hypothetical protein